MHWARKILSDSRGNFAMTTALMAVPLTLGVGIAVDLANLQSAKTSLRDAAETAAVASARSFNANDETRRERAFSMMSQNFDSAAFDTAELNTDVALTPRRSTVEVTTVIPTKLMGLIGQKQLDVSVKVAAETVMEPACVLVNSPNRSASLRFQGHPTLNTENCYVHSNSGSPNSANAQGNPQLSAAEVCLNGGFSGRKWTPGPELGCGTKQDPYFDIKEPDVPPCDHNRMRIGNKDGTSLSPGHYCGGMKLPANSDVSLEPGIYFISGGALELGANANLSGDGVMFYLAGDKSNFDLHSGGNWDINPPTSGEYRGIAIFQDRAAMPRDGNKITGGGRLDMRGIIYAINSDLELHGSPQVYIEGAGTMILTNTLSLQGSPELIINSVEDTSLLPNDRIIGRDAYVRVIH